MLHQKTHREVKNPQISARYLADYMAASETAKRRIVRNCKFQALARVIQHDEAKLILSKFIRSGESDTSVLAQESERLRKRMADSEFERDLYDHNADYVDTFAIVWAWMILPKADILPPGKTHALEINGVKVTTELHFRLRRLTKTNKLMVGAGMLRYAKGTTLAAAIGEWQSAYLFGYLNKIGPEQATEVDRKLCLTLDAACGAIYPAPTDSVRRFQHMESACASIAERWPNIPPPKNAVL
jgi:hypothetical protein